MYCSCDSTGKQVHIYFHLTLRSSDVWCSCEVHSSHLKRLGHLCSFHYQWGWFRCLVWLCNYLTASNTLPKQSFNNLPCTRNPVILVDSCKCAIYASMGLCTVSGVNDKVSEWCLAGNKYGKPASSEIGALWILPSQRSAPELSINRRSWRTREDCSKLDLMLENSWLNPVKTVFQETCKSLSIFLARLARSCSKSCTYLASIAIKMKLFFQDIKVLARILQKKL